jgi:hypothetical protein
MTDKNLVIIKYLELLDNTFTYKSEYSTTDNEKKVVIVSMRPGEKEVLWDGVINDYFEIQIFGGSILEEKTLANKIGDLIGQIVYVTYNNKNYSIVVSQISNPQSIVYEDIRRVGYTLILKTIINEL